MALSYPLENADKNKAKISFQAIEVTPSDLSINIDFNTEWIKTALAGLTELDRSKINTAGPSQEDADSKDNSYGQKTQKRKNTVSISPMNTSPIDGERVDLYLPIAFQVGDRFNYDTPSLGILGGTTLAGLTSGMGAVGSITEGIKSGFASIGNFFGGMESGKLAAVTATRATQSILGRALPEGIRDAVGIAAQVTVNPNIRAAFRGVGLREFTFTFKFIPKSIDENREVEKIIRFFRMHAYPEEPELVYMEYPNMFRIKLMYESSLGANVRIGTPIDLCYLRNVTTTYNPTSQTFHADGMPSEIDMSLSFVEYKTQNRKDIRDEMSYNMTPLNPKPKDLTDDMGSF